MAKANAKDDNSASSNKSADEIELDEEELDEEEATGTANDDDDDDADELDVRIVMPPTFDVESWLHAPISGHNEMAYQLGRLVNAIDCCGLLAYFRMDEQEHRNVLLLADLVAGLAGRFFPPPLAVKLQRTVCNEYGDDGDFGDTDHFESIECYWEADDGDPNPNKPKDEIARKFKYSPIDRILKDHLAGTEFMAWYKFGNVVDAGVRPLQSEWANENFFRSDPERWTNARPDRTWWGLLQNAWSVCIGLVEPLPATDQDRLPCEIVTEIDTVVRQRFRESKSSSATALAPSAAAPVAQEDDVLSSVVDESFDGFHPADAQPPDDFWPDSISGTQKKVVNWILGVSGADYRQLKPYAKSHPSTIWIRKMTSRTVEVFFSTEADHKRAVSRRDRDAK